MLTHLNWAVVLDGKIIALFLTRWRAEKYIETLYNQNAWSIRYIKREDD